jgi:tRNA pseudouridine55 synthase
MISGIVNVLKVPGMTSQDVVNIIRGIYKTKKVGHGGTLDPEAAGVLPVFLGNATKLLEYAMENQKCYRAEAKFGQATDTGDDAGKVIGEAPVPKLTVEEFKAVLESFKGPIQQIPPMYSALKVQGKTLYKLAREGKSIPREPRPITIYGLDLLAYHSPTFCIQVACSKGTYIRTLIEDICKAAHSCGTMTFLLRMQSGPFKVQDALTLEEIEQDPQGALLPLELAVANLPKLIVNELQAYRITCGVKTTIVGSPAGLHALYLGDRFLGTVKVEQEVVQALKILDRPDFKPEKHI